MQKPVFAVQFSVFSIVIVYSVLGCNVAVYRDNDSFCTVISLSAFVTEDIDTFASKTEVLIVLELEDTSLVKYAYAVIAITARHRMITQIVIIIRVSRTLSFIFSRF